MDNTPDLPRIIEGTLHRVLLDSDLKAIFGLKHPWALFYTSLLVSGLRPVDLAMLTHWNLSRERRAIGYYRQGSKRYQEVSVPNKFLDLFPQDVPEDEPLFPTLFSDLEEPEFRSEQLHENLGRPSDFLEALLAAGGRPCASLIAFKVTHDAAVQGENDVFYRLLISRVNNKTGMFDMPQS